MKTQIYRLIKWKNLRQKNRSQINKENLNWGKTGNENFRNLNWKLIHKPHQRDEKRDGRENQRHWKHDWWNEYLHQRKS